VAAVAAVAVAAVATVPAAAAAAAAAGCNTRTPTNAKLALPAPMALQRCISIMRHGLMPRPQPFGPGGTSCTFCRTRRLIRTRAEATATCGRSLWRIERECQRMATIAFKQAVIAASSSKQQQAASSEHHTLLRRLHCAATLS